MKKLIFFLFVSTAGAQIDSIKTFNICDSTVQTLNIYRYRIETYNILLTEPDSLIIYYAYPDSLTCGVSSNYLLLYSQNKRGLWNNPIILDTITWKDTVLIKVKYQPGYLTQSLYDSIPINYILYIPIGIGVPLTPTFK